MMRRLAPYTQWPVQTALLQQLYQQVADGRVPQALLWIGEPAPTLKFAEFFAGILLCTGEAAPCGHCPSCRWMAASNHPDWWLLRTEPGSQVRSEDVERLQAQLQRRSHSGGRVVYCIAGVDELHPVAANRLLKTLEEPLPSVVAMLTARSSLRVLPTLRSRCLAFSLPADPKAPWDDPLSSRLAGCWEPSSQAFAAVCSRVIQWTEDLIQGTKPPLQLAAELHELAEQPADADQQALGTADVLHLVSLCLRDLLHRVAGENTCVRLPASVKLSHLSNLTSAARLAHAIPVVLDTKARIQAHVGTALNLERMCIRLQEVFSGVHRDWRPL
ncbi:MAG: hypothetical protein K6T26_06695 [Alicyclobacillus sp.]|nr:hypothetical protein [Alicyclobacillus sp.]